MHDFDHLLAGLIVLLSMVQAFADPETLKGLPRAAFFKAGALTGLVGGALVLLLWQLAGRSVAEFGLFGWIGPSPLMTAAAAMVWVLFLLVVLQLCRGIWRGRATGYYSGYRHLMPGSRGELGQAYAAGSLAGVGEELAYRGFLLWYLAAFAGLPAAIILSSAIFGVAHGYLGKFGMLLAVLAGLILAGAYVLTGSLVLLIWMHASYNIASFTLGYLLLSAPQTHRA